jgi:hypothetical protein
LLAVLTTFRDPVVKPFHGPSWVYEEKIDRQPAGTLPQHRQQPSVDSAGDAELADVVGPGRRRESTRRIVVRELRGGKGNYAFDCEVKSVRKGYEDYRVIRPHRDLSIGVIDRQGVTQTTK